jgi:pimeloyl-ACP methyl ester carboxylesterase
MVMVMIMTRPLVLLPFFACSGMACTGAPVTPASLPVAKPRNFIVPSDDISLLAHTTGGRDGSAAVIVLSGGPGLSHEYMEPFDALASADLRIIRYDPRGVGRSTQPQDHHGWGIDHQVGDLGAVIKAVRADKVHLVGHSWGGLIAMAYAATYPDHIASLTLVSTVPPSRSEAENGTRRFLAKQREAAANGIIPQQLPQPTADDCGPAVMATMPVYMADPARFKMTPELERTRCVTRANLHIWSAAGRFDYVPLLAAVQVPTTIVFGDSDPHGMEWMDATVAAIPAANKHILPRCGHFPWLECGPSFWPLIRTALGLK